MKKTRIVPMALLGIVAAATFTFAGAGPIAEMFQSQPTSQEFQWRTDLNSAHEEALLTNRPMLIVIEADWCEHCEKMDASTYSDTTIVQHVNESFIPIRLNVDEDQRIAEILEVDRIPCTIALSPRADVLGRIVGFVNTEQYNSTLHAIRALQARVERKLATQMQ